MIRDQRKAHLTIWRVLAVALPLGLSAILGLASHEVSERAAVRLEPPSPAAEDGG